MSAAATIDSWDALADRYGVAYAPQLPTPRQRAFLAVDALEALYGGAAGGGKSSALLMEALRDAGRTGYAALILRRKYTDLALPGAIMDRAHEWLRPQGIPWSDKDKTFRFPNGGTITFGYLDTEQDKFRYQSSEFQCICFDELTQFTQTQYTYLLSRLRKTKTAALADVRLRMRAGSNPGGFGHKWVFDRFVNGKTKREHRVFVPALMGDNPHLDQESYRKSLAELDPITRKQLEEGLWVMDSAGLVYRPAGMTIIDSVPSGDWTYLIGLDFGVTDDNAVSVLGWRAYDRTVYVLEAYKIHAGPSEMAEHVRAVERKYKAVKIVGDTGGLGKAFAKEMRDRYNVPVDPAEKHNKLGYISLLNGELDTGRVRVVGPTCIELLEEWDMLAWHPSRTKEHEGMANHAADATLYGWREARALYEPDPPRRPTEEERIADLERRLWEENAEDE